MAHHHQQYLQCVLDESYMTYPATKPRSELKNWLEDLNLIQIRSFVEVKENGVFEPHAELLMVLDESYDWWSYPPKTTASN